MVEAINTFLTPLFLVGLLGAFNWRMTMGKASRKRNNSRQAYLRGLAQENPKKFKAEWAKRLESWAEEADYRASHLSDRAGKPIPPAFTLVEEAMKELAACGPEAVELARQATMDTMTDSCCKAVATAVYRRIYRLSNARSNQCLMEEGNHRPRW